MENEQSSQHLTKKEEYDLAHKQKKGAEENQIARTHTLKKTLKIVIIVIVIGLVAWGVWYVATLPKVERTNREVALSCTTDMATKFHIHPHLEIVINGQKQEIPANTGISLSNCLHPLHTHDTTNVIHVESPEARDFTLADFFAVWEKTFNKNQILDSVVDESHVIKVTVNALSVDTYENTILRDKDEIVVSYEAKK